MSTTKDHSKYVNYIDSQRFGSNLLDLYNVLQNYLIILQNEQSIVILQDIGLIDIQTECKQPPPWIENNDCNNEKIYEIIVSSTEKLENIRYRTRAKIVIKHVHHNQTIIEICRLWGDLDSFDKLYYIIYRGIYDMFVKIKKPKLIRSFATERIPSEIINKRAPFQSPIPF